MTTAFVLGAIGFSEILTNIVFGSLAIPTLIVGVVLILSCQQKENPSEFIAVDSNVEEEVYFSHIFPSNSDPSTHSNGTGNRNSNHNHLQLRTLQTHELSTHNNHPPSSSIHLPPSFVDMDDDCDDRNIHTTSSSFLYESVAWTPDNEAKSSSQNTNISQQNPTALSDIPNLKHNILVKPNQIMDTLPAVGICLIAGR